MHTDQFLLTVMHDGSVPVHALGEAIAERAWKMQCVEYADAKVRVEPSTPESRWEATREHPPIPLAPTPIPQVRVRKESSLGAWLFIFSPLIALIFLFAYLSFSR